MELYRRYGPALVRKCERMLGNREDAEDIVQTLFIDLLRRGRTDVELPYLYRAATTRSLNRMRDRRRRAELLRRHGHAVLGGAAPPVDRQVISVELLVRLVDGLDAQTSEILVYRYLDHMDLEEIAGLVGTSRKTVGKRLQRARERLAELAGGEA